MLKEKKLTLCSAESCTGGNIAHLITSISGSSAYFKGSVVAYDNSIKENILKVIEDGALGFLTKECDEEEIQAAIIATAHGQKFMCHKVVDIIIDNGDELIPLEIKSGRTITTEYFKNIEYYKVLSGSANAILVYAGSQVQNRSSGVRIVNWKNISKLLL